MILNRLLLAALAAATTFGAIPAASAQTRADDRVTEAASTPDPQDLYEAQLDLVLDPHDPEVVAAARAEGIAEDWIEAASLWSTNMAIGRRTARLTWNICSSTSRLGFSRSIRMTSGSSE